MTLTAITPIKIIDASMFRTVSRTIGVSTTDIIGRMLLCTKQHHLTLPLHIEDQPTNNNYSHSPDKPTIRKNYSFTDYNDISIWINTAVYKSYLEVGPNNTDRLTTLRLNYNTKPSDIDKITIYVPGIFDLFNCTHSDYLRTILQHHSQKYKSLLGETDNMNDVTLYNDIYLLVGIYNDSISNNLIGLNYPILTTKERILGVLSSRFVDEVICDPPLTITNEFINRYNIKYIYPMPVHKSLDRSMLEELFKSPLQLNIVKYIDSEIDNTSLLINDIIHRVTAQRQEYITRQMKKNGVF